MIKKSNFGQISIFIIIGIIIIFFISYLIFFNSEDKKINLNVNKKVTQLEIQPLKEKVDMCLEKQLRRALIISGLKGGFIYDNGEYYSPSAIPPNTYNGEFISNMNLNWNNLLHSTLVHSQGGVFSPNINSNLVLDKGDNGKITIYKYSIKEEFESFILEEFIGCMNLETYSEQGLNVSYDKYGGKIISFNSNSKIFKVSGMDTKKGDKIRFRIGGKEVFGTTINVENNLISKIKIKKNNLIIPEDLSSINVINLDSNVLVNVSFSNEGVSAKLDFPIIINNNEKEDFTYNFANVKIDSRFGLFLKLSNFLLNKKSINKSIDFFDEKQLKELIREFDYFKDDKLEGVRLEKIIINESEEYKKYVFSFIDEKYKILGNPFVFNFGYENKAPTIDTSRFMQDEVSQEGVLFLVSKNQKVDLDLKKLTTDEQSIDNYFSYFIADSYNGIDADYSLSSDGLLSFIGHQQRRYVFDIAVTDGEATRKEPFIFVVGFPDNTNNLAITDCVSFKNNEIEDFFPIANEFKNKVYTYVDKNGYNRAYTYSLFVNPNNPLSNGLSNSQVKFSLTCLVSSKIYEGDVKITNKNTGKLIRKEILDNSTGLISIDSLPFVQEVGITIVDKRAKLQVTQSYNLTIYPSSCLGPNPAEIDKQSLLGGTLSCCDTSKIRDSISTNTPENFVTSSTLFDDNRKIIDASAYFCHDVGNIYANPKLRNMQSEIHRNSNIWENSPKITSLFEGNIVGICNGLSAVGDIESISSNQPDTTFKSVGLTSKGGYISRVMDINLRTVKSANSCEFCYMKTNNDFTILLDNNLVLKTGLKALNNKAGDVGVSTLSQSYLADDIFLKCDNNLYLSNIGNDNSNNWFKNLVNNNANDLLYVSSGYCYQGEKTCSGRKDSPNYDYRVNNNPICQEWSFENGDFVNKPNSGWSCGNNLSCNNGFCK